MKTTLSTLQSCPKEEWFASWFDSVHYHRLYGHHDDREARELIDCLITRGHLRPGATVLDLGCGTGRHSRHLASRGFDVTGIDLSSESLAIARRSERPNLRFIRQDMRLPVRTRQFDHVLNLFTSFGYFDDPGDDMSVVHNMALALKEGGCVILDYLNVAYAEQHLRREEVVETDDVVYRISRWSDRWHFFKRIVIEEPSQDAPLEYVERVAKLTADDFRFMFSLCDLKLEAMYGDYRLSPFVEATSPRLMLVATKERARSVRESSAREVLPDAADGLGRHAKIRSKHRLWNTLRDRGIHPHEFEVSLFG